MAADSDPALETLFLPFTDGVLPWPAEGRVPSESGVLFLRARDGWPLQRWPKAQLLCEQGFKPEAAALQASGFELTDADDGARYPLVLLLPPRQREEARAAYARALASLRPGGRVVACVRNDEGARSAERDLGLTAGAVGNLSKNKCRVFWSSPTATPEADQLLQWQALDAPRKIDGGRFISRPGVFAWDRIDPASALLAEHLPSDLAGSAADLGAGFGYLAVELLNRCPNIRALDLYEAQARALDLARLNLATYEARAQLGYHWFDVTAGLPQRYDVIVSNPPFHAQGSAGRPDIGRRFIEVAAAALNPRGRLWLVANRHLPYESVLDAKFGSVRVVAQRHGFKLIEAVKQ